MKKSEKIKLKHDFINSIVIINSLTSSAGSLIEKISQNKSVLENISKNQLELFSNSMSMIRQQTAKIEKYFEHFL